MAVEAKRGCGYRKIGGLYLVGSGYGIECDRLPIELTVCPCCGHGIKQTRGFTWVDVPSLVGGNHVIQRYEGTGLAVSLEIQPCPDPSECPLCHHVDRMGRAGLLWVGTQFYSTIAEFEYEAKTLGISRRIATIPHGFELGKTWILFAHPRGVLKEGLNSKSTYVPAIFRIWKPQRIERIFKESERGSEKVLADEKRGITPVFVPDNDPDHQGGVYDKPNQNSLFEDEQ